jgi:2-keto-3-deoxy-L-rhamnonate aldolase RhmA
VLFPFVQSADEARQAVAATRYPPQGVRGMAGMSRAAAFGTTPGYLKHANAGIGVILQLETPQALDALESIAGVEGVDALFLGPADLSAHMGHVGELEHPAVVDLMAKAVQRCKALGMPVGTIGDTPRAVAQYRASGFDYVAIGSDLGLLMRGALDAANALRTQEVGGHVHSLLTGTRTQSGGDGDAG